MKNDSISREALKKTIDESTWYHINSYGELVEGAHGDSDAFYKVEDIYNAIDNVPTVDIKDEIAGAYNEGYMCGNKEAEKARPQGEWIVIAEDNDGVHRICCPFCSYEKGSNNTDTIIVTFTNFPKFCENCGAKLKGGAV